METLYVHPNASIIKFTSASRPNSSASASPGRPGSSQGTQAWASPTERTMAAGPMEIYRVPGSVSFLHSGALLHAILPRSQCWCVDGVSKFALRVLPDTYYRIELPGETEEDLQEVEKLKVTLKKVLFYERTPCPFSRAFTVDLPEELEVRKKRRKSSGPAKRWRLERGSSWRPDGWVPPVEGEDEGTDSAEEGDEEEGSDDVARSEVSEVEQDRAVITTPSRPRVLPGLRSVTAPSQTALQSPSPSKLRTRVDVDGTVEVTESVDTGSVRAETPVTRTLQAIPTDMPPSPPDSSMGADYVEGHTQSEEGAEDDRIEDDHVSAKEEQTIESSPRGKREHVGPAPRDGVDTTIDHQDEFPGDEKSIYAGQEPEERETAEPAEPAPTEALVDDPAQSSLADQPALPSTTLKDRPITPESQTTHEDPYAAIQARILARRSIGGTTVFHPGRTSPTRKSTSSNSSTATISSRNSIRSGHQQAFATAMVKKACSVFLGPPARLVAIMLQIAARYADAAFGVNSMFYVESPAGEPRIVPGSYHLEDLRDLDEGEWGDEEGEDEDGMDDFGVPLRSPVRLAGRKGGGRQRSGTEEERRSGVD